VRQRKRMNFYFSIFDTAYSAGVSLQMIDGSAHGKTFFLTTLF
jgi:hypothetical protein